MKKYRFLYPYLFAVTPLLLMFYLNINEVEFDEILRPFGIIIALLFISQSLIAKLFKNKTKARIITWILSLCAFSYNQFFTALGNAFNFREEYYYGNIFIYGWIMFFLALAYILTKNRLLMLKKIDLYLSATSIVFVLFPLTRIGQYYLSNRVSNTAAVQGTSDYGLRLPDNPPDVYFLVFDRYANNFVLQEYYHFDNNPFLTELENKGFVVNADSYSNYIKTGHSLASTLNMEYLNNLSDLLGTENSDMKPVYKLLQNYEVQKIFKSLGYSYLHFGSWWQPTSENEYAERNYSYNLISDLERAFFTSTVLYPIAVRTGIYDIRAEQWERVNYDFEQLAKVADDARPTFVFAHILAPHPPYVFDEDGSLLSMNIASKRSRIENYIHQLKFINKKILELTDKIREVESNSVIVLQADEGPFPVSYENDQASFSWSDATADEIKEKMGILSAYYFPCVNLQIETETPVNTFRHLFNIYFGGNFEVLEDKNYAFLNDARPYEFIDVTSIIQN